MGLGVDGLGLRGVGSVEKLFSVMKQYKFIKIHLSKKIFMSSANQRRLIMIFKSFIEKALIPQIRKNQGSLAQWNKFSSMISSQNINYNQLHLYVDTLPNLNIIGSTNNINISGLNNLSDKNIQKKKEQVQSPEIGFNPNKTFGGERNKMGPFMFGEESNESRRESQRQESVRQRGQHNFSHILSSLQKLVRNVQENQKLIEGQQNRGSWQPQKSHSKSREMQGSKKPNIIPNSNNKSSSRASNPVNLTSTTTPSNYNNSYNNNPLTSPSYNYSQHQSNQGYRNYF